ncbi:MAG: hypothetical protein R3C49_07985 [Planctomycetaceae bacterium]
MALFSCSLDACQAQRIPQRPGVTADLEATRLNQPVKPAFLIQPLVHRLSGQRGQLLTFEFEIESSLEATRLEISSVGMLQQENGVILPDPAVAAAEGLRLLTPSRVDLNVGEKHTARCQLRIPAANNPFLTFGILVKQLPADGDGSGPDNQAQVGIRFMTQYLLRADVEVLGVRGDSVAELKLEGGSLVERNGSAVVTVFVNNATDSAMEYQIRTELTAQDSGKRYRSRLSIPVRAGLETDERFEARILPKTRLRMEGEIEEAVFPGDYALNVELLYKGRVYGRESFPVSISAGDFPAQDATVVRVARDISVEPPALELSLRRGGSRTQSVTIENNSLQPVVARLSARALIGDLSESLVFRPDTVALKPGQKRKALVMLDGRRDFSEHSYAFVNVEVSPEDSDPIGSHDIPVCLLTNSESMPELQPSGLEWTASNGRTGFYFPVKNIGRRHLPLQAQLTLKDEFGRGFVMEDGYGRWLLPNQEDRLWFPLRQIPPPGTYQISVRVNQVDNLPPLEAQQSIHIRTADPEKVSDSTSAPSRN